MTSVTKLSSGLWQISLPFQGEEEIVGSYLLSGKDELAIIDPGPGSTAKALLAAISEAGFEPNQVTHLLVTHIHLDHAGAIGTLLPHMPNAKVCVHSKGAPHLVDPTKFIASATRIYGKHMQELWGEIAPVPQESIQAMEGGDILTVAGRRLEVHYTPGHAVHHVVFFDVHSGELFTGDAVGVHLQGVDYVRPPTPPPDLDLEAWSISLSTIKRLHADVLYLGHFGPNSNPNQQIDRLREKLFSWGEFVLGAMRDGKGEEEIIQELKKHTEPELLRIGGDANTLKRYELTTNYPMTVQGYMRYWKKHHPNTVTP